LLYAGPRLEVISVSILRIFEFITVRARLFSIEKFFVSVAPAPLPERAREGERGEA